MKKKQIITGLFITFACSNVFAVNTTIAKVEDQTNIGITVYNNNLALIKDTRKISLKSGRNRLIFENVSAKIRPETASLNAQDNKNITKLVEQNFDYDLLTPKKLLDKYVGRDIKIIRTNPATGIETPLNATVLSTNSGVVLQVGNHIETGMPGRIQFPDLPKNLRSKPTLIIDLEQETSSQQLFELSYLSTGLSWRADYVARINDSETSINLNAWVTLGNHSGNSYNNVKLQLVAGNVNQVRSANFDKHSLRRERVSLASTSSVSEESLLDYHLYSIENKTNLLNNQTKQIALFSRSMIPITKTYKLGGASYYYRNQYSIIDKKRNPDVIIHFVNNKKSNLALPLPKGIIRSYKNDSNNNLQFVGEDKIEHTAKNETISLKLGKAFDIVSRKKQTDFKIVSNSSSLSRLITESKYEIVISNAKSNDITLLLEEPIPGDWKILKENNAHIKTDSTTAQWKLLIPANDKTLLRYSVRIKH